MSEDKMKYIGNTNGNRSQFMMNNKQIINPNPSNQRNNNKNESQM